VGRPAARAGRFLIAHVGVPAESDPAARERAAPEPAEPNPDARGLAAPEHTAAGRAEDDLPPVTEVGDSPGELLTLAVETASTAGLLLRERFLHGEQLGVESKSTPTDLVSEADLASQRHIREDLALRRPLDGFLGEEGGDEPGTTGLRWVVDPLDGTVNFLFGIPQWCVSVAVGDAQGTVAGAIYDPIREELFKATRGGEASIKFPTNYPLNVPPPPESWPRAYEELTLHGPERAGELAHAMVATGFAYDARVRAAQARVLARVLPHVRDIRRFGSAALDLAWTAAGRYDAYFERTVKPWDIAAGVLLCEAAGLDVVELPAHEDLPWGILVAPPALSGALLELVGGPA
jgi:myo-inositol-1(or 4)-monophosphatase